MKFEQTSIPGVWLIEPKRMGDNRGYFVETYRKDLFDAHIGEVNFIQNNESQSVKGVLRGLHFQRGCMSQAKLVRVSLGKVLDVAVDLRTGSPTRGGYVMVELSDENGRQLFVPKGFAHGFVVLSDVARFQYKVDAPYAPDMEVCIRYDDPDIAVKWPETVTNPILSEKDLRGLGYKDIPLDIFNP